jgi:predicted glycosyltransferase involved in capsule biosynthesis
MKDLTYLMPCRIETDDRLRNVITSVSYILNNFPEAKIILKEVDKVSNFSEHALPKIKKYVKDVSQLKHIFEQSDESFFHKTRILNDLCVASDTNILYNHDVDVVVPKKSHELAYHSIKVEGSDAVYPFGCGIYQWAVNYSDELLDKFLSSYDGKDFDLTVLEGNIVRIPSSIGWGQMITKTCEVSAGLWNEEFISWGAEDCEFYYRINLFGFKVGRVIDDIYHFEHGRTFNSHYHNPKFQANDRLWNWIRTQDKEELTRYYSTLDYIKKRGKELNAGV